MESVTELDSFLRNVLNGLGAPEDFACSTFFSLPPSSPAAQPASSEPEAAPDLSEPGATLGFSEPEPEESLPPSSPAAPPAAQPDLSEPEAGLDFEALLDSLEWEEVRATLTAAVEDLLAQSTPVSSEPSMVEPDALPLQEPQLEIEPELREKTQNWTEVENPVQETNESGTMPQLTGALPAPMGNHYSAQDGAPYNRPMTNQPYSQQYVPQVPEVMAGPYHPMAAPQLSNENPVVPASLLCPLGTINGQMLYTYVTEPCAYSNVTSRKRQRDSHDTNEKPYIKKPLNAFMLFRAEQRQKVMEELNITDSAAVNKVIGERWRMLSQEEQAVYFEQAHAVRRAHEAKYPDWSPKDNFGKKAKRRRSAYTAVPTAYGNHNAAPAAPVWDNSMMMWPNTSSHFPQVPSYQPAPGYGPVHWQTPSY